MKKIYYKIISSIVIYFMLVNTLIADPFIDAVNQGKSIGNELYNRSSDVLKNSSPSNYSNYSIQDYCQRTSNGDNAKYNECINSFSPSGNLPFYQGANGAKGEENLLNNPSNFDDLTNDTFDNITNTNSFNYDNSTDYVNKGLHAYESYDVVRGGLNQPLIKEKQQKVSRGEFPDYNIGKFDISGSVYYDQYDNFLNMIADNCSRIDNYTKTTNYTKVQDIKTCEKALFSVNVCNVDKNVVADCSAKVNAKAPIFSKLDGFVQVTDCVPKTGIVNVTFGCTTCHSGTLPNEIPPNMVYASKTYTVDIYSGTGNVYTTRLGPTALYTGVTESCLSCNNWQNGCSSTNFCSLASTYQSQCNDLMSIYDNSSHPQYLYARSCIDFDNITSCQVLGYNYNPCDQYSFYNNSCLSCNTLWTECQATSCVYSDGMWISGNNTPTSGHWNAVDLTCTTRCRDFNPQNATSDCFEDCSAIYYETQGNTYGDQTFLDWGYCVDCIYYKWYCPTTNTDPDSGYTIFDCNSWQTGCSAEGCVDMNGRLAKPLLTTTFSITPFKLKEDLQNKCLIYETDMNCVEHIGIRRCLDYQNPRPIYIPALGLSYNFSEDNFFVKRDLTDKYSIDNDSDGNYELFIGKLCYDVERSFYCGSNTYQVNTCEQYENDPNCALINTTILSQNNSGTPDTLSYTYDCGQYLPGYDNYTHTVTYDCNGAIRCMGTECKDVLYENNNSFGKTAAAFHAMEQATRNATIECDSEGKNCTISIFKGEAYECKKAVGGWQNCCEDINMITFADYIKLIIGSYGLARISASLAGTTLSQLATQASIAVKSMFVSQAEAMAMKIAAENAAQVAAMTATEVWAESMLNQALVNVYDKMVANGMESLAKTFMEKKISGCGAEYIVQSQLTQQIMTGLSVVMWAYTAYQVADLLIKIIWACEEKELELNAKRPLKVCHSVGSYCKTKTLFGCIEKRDVYCCYDSPLARIINEQGLPQLNRGFGTAQDPDCSGFSMEEFGRINWEEINLEEWVAMLRVAYGQNFFEMNQKDETSPDAVTKKQYQTMEMWRIRECEKSGQNCPQPENPPNYEPLTSGEKPESYFKFGN